MKRRQVTMVETDLRAIVDLFIELGDKLRLHRETWLASPRKPKLRSERSLMILERAKERGTIASGDVKDVIEPSGLRTTYLLSLVRKGYLVRLERGKYGLPQAIA